MTFKEQVKTFFTDQHLFWNMFVGRYSDYIKSDKLYLSLKYLACFGKFINWRNPKTFNEKLNWLKLYDRKPEYTIMVDKYLAKDYVAKIIGEEHIIPLLGVWDNPDQIEWDKLPNQFVIKTNHGCGGMVICKDKANLNIEDATKTLWKGFDFDYFKTGREWPYKNVPHKIIAEEYMEDAKTKELRDYKFFCMDGVCKALYIAKDRQNREEPYFDFFDTEFRHLDIQQGHPNSPEPPAKPETFEEMKSMAEKLSKGMPQARIDFYEVNGKAYFGEIKLSHFSGMTPFHPDSVDKEWGDWITLPNAMGGANC